MFWKVALSVFIICVFSSVSVAADLKVMHTDPAWTGKDVPDKGICEHRGGKGLSPSIQISNIPAGTVKLLVNFTDLDYGNEGGHGGFEVKVSGENSIVFPSMEGEAKDKMPPNVTGVNSHHCFDCSGKYYLGPCSGGRGNNYVVYFYAKNAKGDTIAKGELKLGSN